MSQTATSSRRIGTRGLIAVSAAALAVVCSGSTEAAVKYWDANTTTSGLQAGDGTWDSGTYWNSKSDTTGSNIAWSAGDDAYFTVLGTDNVSIGGTVQVNSLTSSGNSIVNLSGGTLQVGSGGISSTNGSAGPLTINSDVSLSGSQAWTTRWKSPTTIVVNGNISGSAGSQLTIGLLPGADGGVVSLNGNNSYSGGTVLNGGAVTALTLKVGSSTALGTGSVTLKGGTLDVVSVVTTLTNRIVGGTNDITKIKSEAANGALTLSGDFSGSAGNITFDTGSGYVLTGNNQAYGGSITVYQGLSLNNTSSGSGSALWTGTNVYGPLMLNATGGGTFHLGALGGSVPVESRKGTSTVVLGEAGQTAVSTGNIGNASYNNINVLMSGTGTQTISGTARNTANTYTGSTTVEGGTLVAGTNAPTGAIGAFGNSSSAIQLGTASTTSNNWSPSLQIGGAFTVGRAITVNNNATNGTYSIGGSTDSNATFAGAITLNQPLTIRQVATAGSNALSITGGIKAGTNGLQTVTFAGPGATNVSGSAIADNGLNGLAVAVSGGTVTLSNANSYTGNTTIDGGVLKLATDTSNNIASSQRIDIAAGATLDVTGVTGNGGKFLLSPNQVIAGDGTVLGSIALGSGTFAATLGKTVDFRGLDLSSATDALTITNPGFASGTYVIATYTGSLNGTFDTSPSEYKLTYDTANNQILVTVPEPGIVALGAAVSLAALARRSRRGLVR